MKRKLQILWLRLFGTKGQKTKTRTCQWLEGFKSDAVSGWHTCHTKAIFEVQYKGVTVAHVCGHHSITATQRGWKIR